MIKTHGLTHIALAVRDPERSARFYSQVFGAQEYFRDAKSIQRKGPGDWVIMTFEQDAAAAGRIGGISHFGFRLVDPKEIDTAVREVEREGRKVPRQGEFVPGEPYVFIADPDGYEVEVWYE